MYSQHCPAFLCIVILSMLGMIVESIQLPTHSTTSICLYGKAAPQLFLLGTQKSGTTAMGKDMLNAGIKIANAGRCRGKEKKHWWDTCRELHLFDGWCDFKGASSRCGSSEQAPKCISFVNPAVAEGFVNKKFDDSCGNTDEVLADMTPLYHRLPNLPFSLSTLYGNQKSKIMFVILLREPIGRMHSAFYNEVHHGGCENMTFRDMAYRGITHMKSKGAVLEQDYLTDQFYRSMYSLNLEPWLAEFSPKQFVLIPMSMYFASDDNKRLTFAAMSNAWGIHTNTSNVHTELYRRNHNDHKGMREDAGDYVWSEFIRMFDSDRARLAKLLVTWIGHGLTLAGYKGDRSDAEAIDKYLQASW